MLPKLIHHVFRDRVFSFKDVAWLSFFLPTSWGGCFDSPRNTGMSDLHCDPKSEGGKRHDDVYVKKGGVVGTVEADISTNNSKHHWGSPLRI